MFETSGEMVVYIIFVFIFLIVSLFLVHFRWLKSWFKRKGGIKNV